MAGPAKKFICLRDFGDLCVLNSRSVEWSTFLGFDTGRDCGRGFDTGRDTVGRDVLGRDVGRVLGRVLGRDVGRVLGRVLGRDTGLFVPLVLMRFDTGTAR